MCLSRLTEDSDSNAVGSDLSAEWVGDGALVGAAVLSSRLWDTEGVDDPVRKNLLLLNCIHSLKEEKRNLRSYWLEFKKKRYW